VPYNLLLTAREELKVMKQMLACGIPFAYVRWTDGAGQGRDICRLFSSTSDVICH
jgi:hypothetical protein